MSGNHSNGVGIWEHCNATKPFPSNMIQAGVDCDGAAIYVGRVLHKGDVLPAKVIPSRNEAFVSYAGHEILKEEYEVLRYGAYEWKFAKDGSVPKTAMDVGRTKDSETLYMGRGIYSGSQTPGKVHPSHHCCYIPFKGGEVSLPEYEVLCTK